ncbi:two-component system LytT family sensor kinase [Pedobacter sp. UYP30]|uniref:sensor histidine kinase n=1 Tax=Pedobacter sp. UYP30 TaxID=1756400 RepID=UPI003396281C
MTKQIQKWAIANQIHIIGWSLYILCEVVLVGLAVGRFDKPVAYLLHYSLNIILFYSNTLLVLRNGLDRKRWRVVMFSAYLVVEIAIFITLKTFIDAMLVGHQAELFFDFVDLPYLMQTLWRCLFFIGLSCFYYMFLRYEEERLKKELSQRQELESHLRNKELETALHEATNSYLKAQINPHFIFNILGFIHDSVLRTDAQAAQAVIDLSELMRFAVNAGQQDLEPPLMEEILQVESLIRLYQLRFKERVFVEFTHSNVAGEFRLIPLVLLTLVENLFKHGNIHKKDNPAKIDVTTDGKTLTISTYNLKKEDKAPKGLLRGLENIQTRLRLNYKGRFSMEYGTIDSDHFFVRLDINFSVL